MSAVDSAASDARSSLMPSQELINQARRYVRILRSNPPEATGDPTSLEAFNWLLENFGALLLPAEAPPVAGSFPMDAARAGLSIRRKSWPPARRVVLQELTGWGTHFVVSNGPGTTQRLDWKPSAADLVATDWEVSPG